jgi:hypothetical protein
VAKNRYNLPAELPLAWPALFAGLTQADQPAQETQGKEGETAHE